MRALPFTLLLVACATTTRTEPRGGPRGLRASEHLEEARKHDDLARERETSWPTTTAATPGSPEAPVAAPWHRTWDTAAEHRRFAAAHRSEAAALQAAYEEACGNRTLAEVSVSPLVRHGVGGYNVTDGAVIYLSPHAGLPEKLLADLRCHRAWMMLSPGAMDDCPLDLPGLQVDAQGDLDGVTLTLTVPDRLVAELQKRVARELETHARMER
ncbi:MAG TPA: hypothetical protein VFQ53_34680 [Kofleriaceae bacterium]|nr:hypothetical protein [Kofleriaceae bacterium]